MGDHYMRELLRVAVAQICQTIGYNATQTAPLELLQDVLHKFMREFTRDLKRQVEHYNRTEANLDDVTLTLRSINVNLNELLDYINNVEPIPFAVEVPKFPARKDSALNFLKPGSKEVLTRPVHVHDHLPPMLPPEITQPSETPLPSSSNILSDIKTFQDQNNESTVNDEINNDATNKLSNPSILLDKTTLQSLFKTSNSFEDIERPTREVRSVVMTTGGYISPAVEGKTPESLVPDIIDKLLGLDAPPPPAPPPPPPHPSPPPRSINFTPGPAENESLIPSVLETEVSERELMPSNKDFKEPQKILNKKAELLHDLQPKKNKLFNPASTKGSSHDSQVQLLGNYNKKSYMMHQNAANILLKKAKKQKLPTILGLPGTNEKRKPSEKLGKLDAADKAHRKYMKMLQKMAKQGKIPPEVLNNIMGPDKKSKIINSTIVASMPAGPEKLQLEKLLRKQAKQRQKLIKQQMMEVQKKSKKPLQQLPPLVSIFPPKSSEGLNKPLSLNLEEHTVKVEKKDVINISPIKTSFIPNVLTPTSAANHMPETFIPKNNKTPIINEDATVNVVGATAKLLNTQDGKELKLSNEPDRSKLNIFKKISKQKTPKSSSPTPMRIPGVSDTPIINLPSGTTITPAPGPSPINSSLLLTTTPAGRNIFPPIPENTVNPTGNVINIDGTKDKHAVVNLNPYQPTDLSMLNRVFGEKAPEVELINKPKKRGRKPGSKNSPKIPGALSNNVLKKNSKKIKLNNSNIYNPQIPLQLPGEFSAAGMGTLSFDNMAQIFSNTLNSMEWVQNKHLQQQMLLMTTAKDRKEHKKKNKLLKQDFINSDKVMNNIPNMINTTTINIPTNEEVQSLNKKLMRMDTILKVAPSPGASLTDLSIDTSLITGKKLPSPSMFLPARMPLKSPSNTKRMLSAAPDSMTNSMVQPFMLPNRPAFPNLSSNMLSMLQFPFPTRPGLIPTPGLFPTPGLGAFPNNTKNSLLPGLFPFPNLKQTLPDNSSISQESVDLTSGQKKPETNLQNPERSYCNVAPLVPDFLTKLNEQNISGTINKNSQDPPQAYEPDLPKTPKSRNSNSNTLPQDSFVKKMLDVHTPESVAGSLSGKSIPSTPGGFSFNTFEKLIKKSDSPIDLMTLNKQTKSLSDSQESSVDFSVNKKPIHNATVGSGNLCIKTPITINNEPIEVSDDSDETNQAQITPTERRQAYLSASNAVTHTIGQQSQSSATLHNTFNMDDMFVANTSSTGTNLVTKSTETDLSTKEMRKLKKQVKKSSSSINANIINTDKTEGLTTGPGSVGGVGKLAGGADLIPLSSTGLAYSAKNIPYNSLTANANPSFHSHKTDFSSTSIKTSPATTPSSSVFDNLTITPAIPMSATTPSNIVFDLQKKRKEHKKLKKLKEGKVKKKKDKKDKNKSKDKAQKYLLSQTQTSMSSKEKEKEPLAAIEPLANIAPILPSHGSGAGSEKVKEKDLFKKLKKEKKKEKQRTIEELTPQNLNLLQQASGIKSLIHKDSTTTTSTKGSMTLLESEQQHTKKQKLSPALNFSILSGSEHNEIPPIINTATTAPASVVPKLTLKLGSTHSPTPPLDDSHTTNIVSASISAQINPASTPLAVVATPPCQREPSPELARISPLVTRPPKHKLNTSGELVTGSASTTTSVSVANANSLETSEGSKTSSTANSNMIVPPPSPWLSGGTISASSVLLPHQLLHTTKHDMPTAPISADSTSKAANTDRQSPLTLITETSRPSSYIDAEGNRVWICPACGKVDDGSPMIGCDGCDAWYHWVCVGIFVAPKDNEDWFCRVCITRKKGLHGADKKRKRNKKK